MNDKERVSVKEKAAKAFEGSQGIEIHGKGARLWSADRIAGNPTGKGGGKRGKVGGWSASSRRRMREWLLTHEAPEGWEVWSVTLTIPGDEVCPDDAKRIFKNWGGMIVAAGGGSVWRLEVQKRGQLHWHCIVTMPPHSSGVEGFTREAIVEHWRRCLDTLPNQLQKKWKNPETGKWHYNVEVPRSDVMGADLRAVVAEAVSKGEGVAFERYMLDHASKAKQEQAPHGIGRHWGVIGRKVWIETEGEILKLQPYQWHAFRRAYERLCSPVMRKEGVPFGKSVRHRKRARKGSTVSFTRKEVMHRLVEWAATLEMDRDKKPSRNPQRFNSSFQAAIKGVTTQRPSSAVCNDSSSSCEGSEQG